MQSALLNDYAGRLSAVRTTWMLPGRRGFAFNLRAGCLALAVMLGSAVAAPGEETATTVGWEEQASAVVEPAGGPVDHFSVTVSLKLSPADREAEAASAAPSMQYRLREGGSFARYVERRPEHGRKSWLGRLIGQADTSSVGMGNLRAGYGPQFDDETEVTRGHNGTAWEERSCIFVEICFRL